ncbi:MAG: hypothetical protein IPH35_19155 [Rhodoferax sp.]|nr:hypothetical protein [Rhodoferax sp.]
MGHIGLGGSRIVAPLARANSEHASQLLASMASDHLSTRELQAWFSHYQAAQHTQRQRMVEHPRLFIDSLNERQSQSIAKDLRADLNVRWLLSWLPASTAATRTPTPSATDRPVGTNAKGRVSAPACSAGTSEQRTYQAGAMTPIDIRASVLTLHQQSTGLREISRV